MKAGIITHYDVHNHGAQLQLYALSAQLKKYGYDARALTYNKNYDFMELGVENKYNISIRSIPYYLKYLCNKGFSRTFYNFRKKCKLDEFRKKNRLVGEYYSKAKDLDVVVIGSDEIFSIEPGLNPCFWGFGVPCKHILSYAASCGPTTEEFICEHFADEFVRAGVDRINHISVRDRNTYDIVSARTDKNVEIVCDPVLLYDFEDEWKMFGQRQTSEKYCLVYSYDNNMNDEESISSIKKYAFNHNLKIYSVGYYHKWCDKNIVASPLDLLSWFKNAHCVFTDTFHGTVVSLISNSDFFVRLSGNKNKLLFLLEQYGVVDRMVSSFKETTHETKKSIDYEIVNKRIVQLRKSSQSFLINALEDEK